MPRLISLDDPAACDPVVSGGKAAFLAVARQRGLPVPSGFVVPCQVAQPWLDQASVVAAKRGAPAARSWLASLELDQPLAEELAQAAGSLGPRVIVRSSSPFEIDPAWSGAFLSYTDLAPVEAARAVAGVWSSPYGRQAAEILELTGNGLATVSIAVLVQPALQLSWGGIARFDGEAIDIRGTSGSLPALLSGWERGTHARVADDADTVLETSGGLPDRCVFEVASLLRRVAAEVGGTEIEWGLEADGALYLLQVRHAASHSAPPNPRVVDLAVSRATRTLALVVGLESGALLDELILPWAASARSLDINASAIGGGSAADVARALQLADGLAEAAWGLSAPEARARAGMALDGLASVDPAAQRTLEALCPVSEETAQHVVGLLRGAGARLSAAGRLPRPEAIWQLPRTQLEKAFTGSGQLSLERGRSWEAFAFAATWASGRRVDGAPAAPGRRAGGLTSVALPPSEPPRPGTILHADAPHPVLAPLLWSALAVVTERGDPAAHLATVARSLNVPAITGARLGATSPGAVVAVDGDHGRLVILERVAPGP